MKKCTVYYNNRKIEYYIIRKNVKNINISVKSNEVLVSANRNVTQKYIEQIIMSKAKWILKNLDKLNSMPKEIDYKTGDIIFYLGMSYNLHVIENIKDIVHLEQDNIYIYTKKVDDRDHKKKIFYNWLRKNAFVKFNESIDTNINMVKSYGITKPEFTIRKMKSRWGSCSINKNKITLNVELIKYPMKCIDYVVLHELVHFIIPNHSKDFYNIIEKLMPDWKDRKDRLKSVIAG